MASKPRFAKPWRFGGPGHPPVTFGPIRGEWFLSLDLLWPAVVWNGGRCWAYLHDLDHRALHRVIADLREAELDRHYPHGLLGWRS
jgi:hypothetical protein